METREENQEDSLLKKGILVAIGAALVNKALKGNLWTAPIFLILVFALPVFFVFEFLISLPLAFKFILGLCLTLYLLRDQIPQPDTKLPREKPRFSREELDKVYFRAMENLEEGRISDKQFLDVAEAVNERKKYLSPSSP